MKKETRKGLFFMRASALRFSIVQLQALAPLVISHARIKGKERLLFLRVLCLSALSKPLPLFYCFRLFI
jgi:hypothetical protein